jgi:hypothetical protein
VLVEAAWSYRHPARVSETLRARLQGLPKAVRDIARKAQIRLCGRYRRLKRRRQESCRTMIIQRQRASRLVDVKLTTVAGAGRA